MSDADGVHASGAKVAEAADPLSAFYASAHLPPPVIELVVSDSVPPPYHRLLVHDRDMTPTLEAHYGQTISLKVLEKKQVGQVLLRRVLLVGDADGQVTEFAIRGADVDLVRRVLGSRCTVVQRCVQHKRVGHATDIESRIE